MAAIIDTTAPIHAPVEEPFPSVVPSRSPGSTTRVDPGERVAMFLAPEGAPAQLLWRRIITTAVVGVLLWLVVSTAMTVGAWASGTSAAVAAPSDAPAVHVVEPGDTVWSIARQYRPEGDIRPFVDTIVALNGGSELLVGQRVRLTP